MARVTIYLSEELHRRWREASWVNLSKLAARALTELLDRDEEDAGETVWLCEMCERRVGRALRIPSASEGPAMHTGYALVTPAASGNGRSAAS
ncbi:MAG: hypothetical protein QOI86_2883 [Actinomycetota bacterium]|jgi:hypothetical protein|nr:hypothetical protein [Actinomycetota bacterium]